MFLWFPGAYRSAGEATSGQKGVCALLSSPEHLCVCTIPALSHGRGPPPETNPKAPFFLSSLESNWVLSLWSLPCAQEVEVPALPSMIRIMETARSVLDWEGLHNVWYMFGVCAYAYDGYVHVCVFECVCVCMCTGVCICLGECVHAFVKCVLWGLCMCVFAFWSYIGWAALDEEIVSSHHCFLETTESKQGRKCWRWTRHTCIMQEELFFLEPPFFSSVALGKLPNLSEPLFFLL